MFAVNTRTTMSSLLGRLLTLAAIAAASLTLLTAASAHADTKDGPPGSSKGCAVEDENGNVTYVPAGTHYLLFTCGEDGEWHGGWLITGIKQQLPPTSGGGGIVRTNGINRVEATQALAKPAPKPKPRPHHKHKKLKHARR
jgi:hypothetical protein